jgi:hypothetical protein
MLPWQLLPNGIIQTIGKIFGDIDVEVCYLLYEMVLIIGLLAGFNDSLCDLRIVDVAEGQLF